MHKSYYKPKSQLECLDCKKKQGRDLKAKNEAWMLIYYFSSGCAISHQQQPLADGAPPHLFFLSSA
jgi:hypothetical protein